MCPLRNAEKSHAAAGGIFAGLCPDAWVTSLADIRYDELYARGYRVAAFDIDNTLVRHNAPPDLKTQELFRNLWEMGYAIWLISNNQEPRVKSFADSSGVSYICKAGKPSARGYLQACREAGADPAEMVFAGDQIFTDIWGARRAGVYSVLVNPICPSEEIQIFLKRVPEWLVLARYRRGLRRMGVSGIPPIGYQEKKRPHIVPPPAKARRNS